MKYIVVLFLIIPCFLNCQTNESDTLNFKADLSFTGFWQDGNVETLILRAKSEVSFKPLKKWVFKTRNSYVYQEFGKEKADADFLSLNFIYFNPKRKIYPLALGFMSTNFRREIEFRSLVGAGVSFQAYSKKKDWLKMSLTSEYEQTRFNETDFNKDYYDGKSILDTFRATLWVNGKYYLFKDKVILTHESYVQPSLERGDNYRWQADLGVELPVWSFLNFKVNYLHTFESLVISGQNQEDTFLTFGFTIKSY